MSSAKKAEIAGLLGPTVRALGLELWGVELALSRSRSLLRLYIDHPERMVTLDDCESVSREVSAVMDVNDPISGNYTLEVSSPGLDRPLFEARHYLRYVGSVVRAQTLTPVDGRRRFQGKIASADGARVVIEVDTGPVSLLIADIEKAKLVPQFETNAKAQRARGGKHDE